MNLTAHNSLDPIQQFDEDLKNSIDMRDKKDSVKILAGKVGPLVANAIAIDRGLKSSYYMQ